MDLSIPKPPSKLISRVHGTPDFVGFDRIGKLVALDIFSAVNAHIQFDKPMRVLDFGCGCARVLRYMSAIAPQSTFEAVDIDREAIQWCRENFQAEVQRGVFEFVIGPDYPPTAIDSDSIDFVYAISVFTHLPEDMQFQWLDELCRVTKSGGLLAISIANDFLIRKHLSLANSRALDEKGFYYFPYESTDGLPSYYQAAWHSRDYIERTWSRYFKIVQHIPAGIADHQDLVVCVKR